MKKEQSTPKYKVGEWVIHGTTKVKVLTYTSYGEYIIRHPVYGIMQVPGFTLRPYPKLKYLEGEEVYYKDGTIQVISAVGNPYDRYPYYIGTIRVSEKDLMPRDKSLEEFKSEFDEAIKHQILEEVLKLCTLYPDRVREYYETLV